MPVLFFHLELNDGAAKELTAALGSAAAATADLALPPGSVEYGTLPDGSFWEVKASHDATSLYAVQAEEHQPRRPGLVVTEVTIEICVPRHLSDDVANRVRLAANGHVSRWAHGSLHQVMRSEFGEWFAGIGHVGDG